MILHKHVSKNSSGRDFIVGDIHGCYAELMAQLAALDFDAQKDRLFAVGDLIDRGDDSEAVLALLNEPWFFSVLGNHEDMFIGRFAYQDAHDTVMHREHGGAWADDLADEQIEHYVELMRDLPWAMTLETNQGRVGLVHAEVKNEDWLMQQDLKRPWRPCLWSFSKVDAFLEGDVAADVANIDRVISGHVACDRTLVIGNHWFIDTYYRGGALTIINVAQLFETVS